MDGLGGGAPTGPYSGNSGFAGGLMQGARNATMRRVAHKKNQLELLRMMQRDTPKQPSSVKEYEYARQGGFNGGYTDFLKMKGESAATKINMGAEGARIVSQEDKVKLGLDPDQPFVWNKDNEPKPVKTSSFTEANLAASGYHNRMHESDLVMKDLTEQGFDPAQITEYAADQAGVVGNFFKSPEGQKYRQAQEDWVRAKLRKESGAVIADEEMAREITTYFPQPGDSKDVIQQKQMARENARRGLADASGGKAKYSEIYKPKVKLIPEEFDEFRQRAMSEGAL